MSGVESFYREILGRLDGGEVTAKEEVHRLKMELTRKHALPRIPRDSEILANAPPRLRHSLAPLLRTKPSRTASGVAVVAAMTAPHDCPHGVCVYCPGGPRFGTPQSYTGREPAAMRAARHGYDPYGQTRNRLAQLRAMGHPTDKVDFIVLGGTFTSLDVGYRERFIKGCFDGLNDVVSKDLESAHRVNETAESRCIGLTIETKPERFLGPEVEHSLHLGTTRVELGLQSTYDDVLKRVNRGHTDADSRRATRRAKDAGLKVGFHMMPGLPGSDPDRDFESFRTLFEVPDYRPDLLKIYPTLVLPGTGLHRLWKRGLYTPLGTEEAVDLLARIKAIVPPWVRIQRIQREIEVPTVQAGPRKGHLRELALDRLREDRRRCRCIRCREVGLLRAPAQSFDPRLFETRYEASGGTEVFLSYEDAGRTRLAGYARLRLGPTGTFLRELKVVGPVVRIHEEPDAQWQHRGLGRALVSRCEEIARRESGGCRLYVTSGVGARVYYRKLGYRREGPYMVKALDGSA